jgi:hypothetical protein
MVTEKWVLNTDPVNNLKHLSSHSLLHFLLQLVQECYCNDSD